MDFVPWHEFGLAIYHSSILVCIYLGLFIITEFLFSPCNHVTKGKQAWLKFEINLYKNIFFVYKLECITYPLCYSMIHMSVILNGILLNIALALIPMQLVTLKINSLKVYWESWSFSIWWGAFLSVPELNFTAGSQIRKPGSWCVDESLILSFATPNRDETAWSLLVVKIFLTNSNQMGLYICAWSGCPVPWDH